MLRPGSGFVLYGKMSSMEPIRPIPIMKRKVFFPSRLQKNNSSHFISSLSCHLFIQTPDPCDQPPTVELKTVLTREAEKEQGDGEAQDVHGRVARFL